MMSRRKGASATRRATKHNEDLIEDGNHNGPSSDAEHAREETGQAAGGPQYHRQKNQMAHDPESASLNIAVSTAGTRMRDWMASTICGTPIVVARKLASHRGSELTRSAERVSRPRLTREPRWV